MLKTLARKNGELSRCKNGLPRAKQARPRVSLPGLNPCSGVMENGARVVPRMMREWMTRWPVRERVVMASLR